MAFNYSSPSGIKLQSKEYNLLDRVDRCPYPLKGFAYQYNDFNNLADLHSNITVELSDEIKSRAYPCKITPEEREAIIGELYARIEETTALYNQKLQELRNARGPMGDQLGKELRILENEKERLLGTLDLYENATKASDGNYVFKVYNEILGEYISREKKVVLYYNAISQYNSTDLFAVVYVHEMMHAYLDCGYVKYYFEQIEEPIVECGMLCFFKKFDRRIREFAEELVKEKQKSLGIAHYGFGYCLFKNSTKVDWLDKYYNVKPQLVFNGPNIQNYLDFWRAGVYPFGNEVFCMAILYLVLQMDFNITNAIYSVKGNANASPSRKVSAHTHPFAIYLSTLQKGGDRQYTDLTIGSYLSSLKRPLFQKIFIRHGLNAAFYQNTDIALLHDVYYELKLSGSQDAIDLRDLTKQACVSALRQYTNYLRDNGLATNDSGEVFPER